MPEDKKKNAKRLATALAIAVARNQRAQLAKELGVTPQAIDNMPADPWLMEVLRTLGEDPGPVPTHGRRLYDDHPHFRRSR